MKQEHTPGPWKVFIDDRNIVGIEWKSGIVCDRVGEILESDAFDSAFLLADAHLLAAAPDLLAACEAALLRWYDDDSRGYGTDADGKVAQQLVAAIAKARSVDVVK